MSSGNIWGTPQGRNLWSRKGRMKTALTTILKEILKSINGATWPSSLTATVLQAFPHEDRAAPEKPMRRIHSRSVWQRLPLPSEHASKGDGRDLGKGRKDSWHSSSPRVQQIWFRKTGSQGSQIHPAFCRHSCPSQCPKFGTCLSEGINACWSGDTVCQLMQNTSYMLNELQNRKPSRESRSVKIKTSRD